MSHGLQPKTMHFVLFYTMSHFIFIGLGSTELLSWTNLFQNCTS